MELNRIEINQKFLESILPVLVTLKKKLHAEFVVFGSAPLYLFGVMEFKSMDDLHDLDIVLKEDSRIPARAKKVLFHNDPRQVIYKLDVQGVAVDMGMPWPGRKRIHRQIFVNPIVVKGFQFANLEIVRRWKELMVQEYDREKDKDYLARIKAYRKRNMKMRIREARAEEAEEILRLKDEVWAATYPNRKHGITVRDIRARKKVNQKSVFVMQDIIANKNATERIWIAKDGTVLIGICSAEKIRSKHKIGALYILPGYQGLGIGKRLMDAAFKWLGDEKDVSLGVAEYNVQAINFYKKHGFEIKGNMGGYVLPSGKKIPLLCMVKKCRK